MHFSAKFGYFIKPARIHIAVRKSIQQVSERAYIKFAVKKLGAFVADSFKIFYVSIEK